MLSEMRQSTHPEIFGLSSSRTDEWAGMLSTWIFFFLRKKAVLQQLTGLLVFLLHPRLGLILLLPGHLILESLAELTWESSFLQNTGVAAQRAKSEE